MQRVDNVPDGARIDDDPARYPPTYDEGMAAQQRANEIMWERHLEDICIARSMIMTTPTRTP